MQKKHIALVVVTVLVVAGLSAAAVVKYENRPKPVPGETLSQALQGQKNAETTLAQHDAVNAQTLKQDENTINLLTSQKASVCQALTLHKLTNPACQ